MPVNILCWLQFKQMKLELSWIEECPHAYICLQPQVSPWTLTFWLHTSNGVFDVNGNIKVNDQLYVKYH